MPVHHPPLEALVAFAAGIGAGEEEVLIACHLTRCPTCRDEVARAEGLVGAIAVPAVGIEVPVDVVAAVFARLGEVDAVAGPGTQKPSTGPEEVQLPAPFVRRFGTFGSLPFRSVGRGVRIARLPSESRQRAYVVDFPPGFVVPDHGHHGLERGLVLRGGYTWQSEVHGVGDVSWQTDHHAGVVIDPDGPCTALFVSDGPISVGGRWTDAVLDWWLLG
jgi:putative transcriptional regulator